MKFKQDKRNYIIAALCLIVVVMGVGYAAFSQLLTINGTANITNSWCVGFDNTKTDTMQITKGVSTGTEPTGTMTYSGTACGTNLVPNSSLSARFYQPGDQIEYTLTIVNKSTVTAAIKSILVDNESVTSNTTKKKDNITYIIEMPETTTLAPNASTTMKVIAKFQNETDISGPYSGETKSIEVKINAEQDDGDGGMNVSPVNNRYTGPIYRWSTTQAIIGDLIVPDSITDWCMFGDISGNEVNSCDHLNQRFNTENECENFIQENQQLVEQYNLSNVTCNQKTTTYEGIGSYTTNPTTLGKSYYLKHDVVDDRITTSYVCFVYNNTEQCLKGGDDETTFEINTRIIKDYQEFYNLKDYELSTGIGCTFNSSQSSCSGSNINGVQALANGQIWVSGSNSGYCYILTNLDSSCHE